MLPFCTRNPEFGKVMVREAQLGCDFAKRFSRESVLPGYGIRPYIKDGLYSHLEEFVEKSIHGLPLVTRSVDHMRCIAFPHDGRSPESVPFASRGVPGIARIDHSQKRLLVNATIGRKHFADCG